MEGNVWISIAKGGYRGYPSIYREGWTFARRCFLSPTLSFPFLPSLWITEIGLYRADCREFDLSRKKRPTFPLLLWNDPSTIARTTSPRLNDRFHPRFWEQIFSLSSPDREGQPRSLSPASLSSKLSNLLSNKLFPSARVRQFRTRIAETRQ